MNFAFDHEKLAVYQESLVFCGWVGELLDQVEAKLVAPEAVILEKQRLFRVVQMIMGLLRRFSPHADVLREEPGDAATAGDYDHE